MKKATFFYLKPEIDPADYGFVKKNFRGEYDYWEWHKPGCRCGLQIDVSSLRIIPYLGFSSSNIAKLIEMAEGHAIIVDDDTTEQRSYIYRLSYEEVLAVEKMRGHQKEEGQ